MEVPNGERLTVKESQLDDKSRRGITGSVLLTMTMLGIGVKLTDAVSLL